MNASRWWNLVWLWLAAAPLAWAGQYVLMAGQTNTVPIAARVLNGEQVCNLEITVQGRAPFQREVRAPYFETRIAITPQDEDSISVSWRGQFKRVNDQVVNACPTQGQTQFAVVDDNTQTYAEWGRIWARLNPDKASCVRSAFQHEGIRPEWFDFSNPQVSAEDWKIQRAFSQCDAFLAQKKAWGSNNPQGHACTLPGGLSTRCEGFFSATVNGKTQVISRDQAIARQLDNEPWSTGVREMAGAKSARLKKEQDRLDALAAAEAAKIKAEEDARLLVLKQAQEAKEAEARARQAKIDALRAQIAEEKERKEKERLENRNWLLKQIDKVKGDGKADGKTDSKTESKSDTKTEPKTEPKPEAKIPEPQAEASAASGSKDKPSAPASPPAASPAAAASAAATIK
jgi:hypothetical protein